MMLRPATAEDDDAIWRILEPVIRAGESYALPRTMGRAAALAYWRQDREVFVAVREARVVGTFYLRANQLGGGGHVANCGYATALEATGQGVARAMGAHSLGLAAARGFRAMQFNFVVASNVRAVRLWEQLGFTTLAQLPGAFHHPVLGYVNALVMWRAL